MLRKKGCKPLVLAVAVSFMAMLFFSGLPARVSSAEAVPYGQTFQRDYISSVDGVSLPCSIYIPPYGASQYMPVWVDLHAFGGPGGIRWDWAEWARQRGWMIISPWGRNFKGLWTDGLEPAGTTKEPCIYDDFATGAVGWSKLSGSWAQNTTDQCYQQSDTSGTWKMAMRGSSTGADYSVSVDIKELASGAGNSAAGIVFRRQVNGDCYWLDLFNAGQTRQLRLFKFKGGVWTPLAVDDLGSSFDLRVKHNIKLMTFGDYMEVRVDGQVHDLDTALTYHKDPTESPGRHDSNFTSGDVGLVSYGGSHQFYNFRMQNEFLYGQKDLMDTIEQFFEEFSSDPTYRADPSRVYLSGFSVGGTGAWNLGMQYPDMFSAMHPSAGSTDMTEEYKWMNTQYPDQLFNPNGTPPRFYSEQDFLYNEVTEEILGGKPGSAKEIDSRMHEFSARDILENSLNMPLRIEHPAYDTIFPNNNGPMEVWWSSMDGLISATTQATTAYAQDQYPWNKWKTVPNLTSTRKETAMYSEAGDPPSDPTNIWDNSRYDQYFQGGGHGACYSDWLWAGRHVNFFERALSDLGGSHIDPDEVAYKTYDNIRNKAWWLTIDIAAPNQDLPGLARVKRDKTLNTVQVHVKNVGTTTLDLARMGISMDPGKSLQLTVDNNTVQSEPLIDSSNKTDLRLAGEWDAAAAYMVKVNGNPASFNLTPTSMTISGVQTQPASTVVIGLPQTQGNMLANAGFEQNMDNWTTSVSGGGQAMFEVSNQKADAHSGVGSARIKDATAAGAPYTASYSSRRVGVIPGKEYSLGAFVKTRALRARTRVYDNGKYNVDEKNNARARIGIIWLDGSGALISESDSTALTNTNDWKPLEVKATAAPANAAYAQVILKTESPGAAGNSGSAWFDDISLRRAYPVSGYPAPAITGLSPDSKTVGEAAFTLTVNGTGFNSSSVVKWNNNPKATTYVSATQLTVPVSAADIAAAGTASVTVFNPAPGGGTSNAATLTVNNPAPAITGLSPDSKTVGEAAFTLTVNGTNFVAGSVVRWNGSDRPTTYVSATQLKAAIAASDMKTAGKAEVTVFNPAPGGGTSNAQAFTVNNPVPTLNASSFYFAEGYTGTNFQEYLCLGNPNSTAATASVTYLFSDGTTKPASYSVPATGRTTVNVNSEVGAGKEVSIQVLSNTANLVAERPMYFNYNGLWTGGSDAVGATAPNTSWYFAEGNTLPNFDEYVTVLNPGDAPANLIFHYMLEGQGEKDAPGSVGAHSRATFNTKNQIGGNLNASLHLSSDHAVVAERPMYFNYQGLASNNWTGGHDVLGANSPQKQWYLAEGTTRAGFEEWLTLQNPGSSPITVNARYQLGSGQGTPINKSYIVPAQQRLTVSVNLEIGSNKDDSVFLSSTSDFIAERPMYFNYQGAWTGGSDVLGANGSAKTWLFAEGTTRDNFNEWLCLQNPGSSDAHVTISYYTSTGKTIQKPWTVSANSRLTVNVNQDAGANQDISAKVSSDQPVIAERPMYFDYNGWTGGHDVVGFVPSP